jgi:hypothetical protein
LKTHTHRHSKIVTLPPCSKKRFVRIINQNIMHVLGWTLLVIVVVLLGVYWVHSSRSKGNGLNNKAPVVVAAVGGAKNGFVENTVQGAGIMATGTVKAVGDGTKKIVSGLNDAASNDTVQMAMDVLAKNAKAGIHPAALPAAAAAAPAIDVPARNSSAMQSFIDQTFEQLRTEFKNPQE